MDDLNLISQLKEGFVPHYQYLCSNVEKVKLEDGRVFCSASCVYYLNIVIENVNNALGVNNKSLNNYECGNRTYPPRFRPTLDFTEDMGEELTNTYHNLILVMMWSIKLGRIDILTELSC